jgi:hypothetical protein
MGCGGSTENVKEMKPMEVPEKAIMKPQGERIDHPPEQKEIQKIHEEMKETKEEEKSERKEVIPLPPHPEPRHQNIHEQKEKEREKEKESEAAERKKKEEQKEKATAGGVITNQLSNAFQNKKLSKIQLEKEKEVLSHLLRSSTLMQEQRLMEMFQSLTPKMRFQAAKKLQRADVQRSSAIEWIQIEWRAKLARKRLGPIASLWRSPPSPLLSELMRDEWSENVREEKRLRSFSSVRSVSLEQRRSSWLSKPREKDSVEKVPQSTFRSLPPPPLSCLCVTLSPPLPVRLEKQVSSRVALSSEGGVGCQHLPPVSLAHSSLEKRTSQTKN